jgi:riboflavin kinase/FMN adenylyltransferase
MKVIKRISGLNLKSCVLTIGNFDGVHIGHQEILTTARQTADRKKNKLVVMTFDPHPLAVLSPEKAPATLTPPLLKQHLLARLGVDCLFILKSTPRLLKLSPADFIERFIIKIIRPCVVIEGDDFNFGSGRTGSVHTLQKILAEKGTGVIIVPSKHAKLTGQTVEVSSTVIRKLLLEGNVSDAAIELGRPYRLIGRIIKGRGKGAKLGFPTANMRPPRQLVPADGVYAGFVQIAAAEKKVCSSADKIPAVFSLGRTRTFGNDRPRLIEAHLLIKDVDDLYGKWLAMDFITRLRSQQKFETESQLISQIAKDCQKAKKILSEAKTKRLLF